jgi:hypothetical protein
MLREAAVNSRPAALAAPVRVALVCAALAAFAPAVPARAASGDSALLASTKACCEDPSGFTYQPLPADGAVDFTIDRRSPLFEFQSGRSFFHAFRLPTSGKPYLVELRSFLDGRAPRDARVFYPVVAILTDDFLVSRATDLDALRFDLPMLERTTAPAYRLQVPLDPSSRRERYLVVFTPAPLLEARPVDASTPGAAQQAARSAYLGASAFGRLSVTVRPLSVGAASDAPAGEPAAPRAPVEPSEPPTP